MANSLNCTEENRKKVSDAEGGKKYSYFEYSEKSLKHIASKDIHEINWTECANVIQAIYPENLICGGLFDRFLIFEISNNARKDPPKIAYGNLLSRPNNKKTGKILLEQMIDFFSSNGVIVHESWKEVLNEVKGGKNNAK